MYLSTGVNNDKDSYFSTKLDIMQQFVLHIKFRKRGDFMKCFYSPVEQKFIYIASLIEKYGFQTSLALSIAALIHSIIF